MGWMSSDDWGNKKEMVEHLRNRKFVEGVTMTKSSVVGNNHWYLLNYNGKTVICLDVMSGGFGRKGSPEWGYKDLSEDSGPVAVNCPISFLKQASEPTGYAIAWRDRVTAYHRAKKSKPTATVGMFLECGGVLYELVRNLGRRGWTVANPHKVEYRMSAGQVSSALMKLAESVSI